MESLRERKKAATRSRISDVATAMMVERGFDNVTIAEIAEAAEVSKVTVFNYFPRKEDIYFDRGPEASALIEAVRDRAPGETPLRALRRLTLRLAEERHPIGGFRDTFPTFWRTVQESPALRARAREAAEELESELAGLIAETSDDPYPRLTAALIMTAYRTVYLDGIRRMLDGDSAEDVTRDHIAAVARAFDTLERGLR